LRLDPQCKEPQSEGQQYEWSQSVNLKNTSPITAEGPKKIPRVSPPRKKKTRGVARPVEPSWPEQAVEQQVEQQPTVIKVDRTAFRVLSIAFKSLDGRRPGEIAWNEVLHTMRAIRFMARQTPARHYDFVHEDPHVGPISILAHKPHSNKFPIQQFDWFVNRLKATYGWFRVENFEVED
jgi:hypothetical protein